MYVYADEVAVPRALLQRVYAETTGSGPAHEELRSFLHELELYEHPLTADASKFKVLNLKDIYALQVVESVVLKTKREHS